MMADDNLHDLLQRDEANRARALALESFIVEAPAGAGKTELLTQRYLRLLATVDEPEEIIAITFTNKAAGEMRERILHNLSVARSGVVPEAAHKRITYDLARAALARADQCQWQLEQQPGRLRLTTIDALCAGIARQMPLLSSFGTQPAVAEDTRRHYEEAARRTLAHVYGDADGALAEPVAVALAHLDNDSARFTRLLADMLARREQWQRIGTLDHPESAISEALQAMVNAELQRIATCCDARWQQEVMPLARFAASNLGGGCLLDWYEPLSADLAALPAWQAVADLLLTQAGERRKRLTKNEGFPSDDKPRKEAMLTLLEQLSERHIASLRRVRELPVIDHADDEVVRALVSVLKLAAAELWLVFREAGEVDFGELAMRAITALGGEGSNPTDLALRLDYRIRHLLVDEFQDTSPLQIALLERLTAGWQAGDGRTLFLVGDPMQSIYRFRKADVGLFLRVAERGIGSVALTSLRLSRNNRSYPAVVDWINTHFPPVFPASDEPLAGEIRYREFVATRPALADAGVTVHPLLCASDEDKADVKAREAAAIIDIIAAEWQSDPTRTIAVLVRAREHLQALVAALRRHPARWRFSAVDVEPLLGRQVVQDLISLTHAVHHRADRVHWLAILRAPWCGLTLADLHALAADNHEATLWSLMHDPLRLDRLSPDGRRRLAHVDACMAEALAGKGRQSRRRWVEGLWRKLGGPACTDAAGQADAQAFFRRLDALDRSGRFVLDRLEADMKALFAAADAESDGRLQLMTIHKSKGLEFDTVILPGLHRVLPDNDTPLLIWDSFLLGDGERLAAAPVNSRRTRSEGPTAYDFLRRVERTRGANEDVRVLYVAATRAIRRLHLVGVASIDSAGGLRTPRSGAMLERLWPAVAEDFAQGAASGAYVPAELRSAAHSAAHIEPAVLWRLRKPQIPEQWQAPLMPVAAETPAEETNAPFAAALGTLAHACLEQIAGAARLWTVAEVRERQSAFARWLGSRGWSPRESAEGAKAVADMLCTTLASADGQWVLSVQQDAAAELALAKVSPHGTARIQVVDRCFVADGARWIVDYKTASLGKMPEESRLREHAEHYRSQLQRYAELFADEGLPVRCAILYVTYGKLVGLD